VSEGIDKGEVRKVCAEPTCPVHHPKMRPQHIADNSKAKAEQEKQRKEAAIANTTRIRILAAITAAVPVRLMKRDLLFVAERLASLLDENRLAIVAKQYGIRKAKDSDSLGKLFAAYLRRAEEGVLGKVLVETTILYMATRHDPSQVLHDAAAVYKVDTDAIALKVKQEFAAKQKTQTAKKTVAKSQPGAVKKAKAA
jgi:ParB family chromosome partitioning protein